MNQGEIFTGVAVMDKSSFDSAVRPAMEYAPPEDRKELVDRAAERYLARELSVFLEAMVQTMLSKVDFTTPDFDISKHEFEMTLKIQPLGTNSTVQR